MRPRLSIVSGVSIAGLLAVLSLTGCEPLPTAREGAGARPSIAPTSSVDAPLFSASAALASGANSVAPGGLGAPGSTAPPHPDVTLTPGGGVHDERGMVSSEDAHATRIGAEVLARGGNAVDAAVAVGYTLAVTHQVAGSLGGGGFMIVRLANGQIHAIDFRELAPAAATVELNEKQLREGAHGYLSAAVPGVVAGYDLVRERFGSLPLAELIAPAIRLAEQGHRYSDRQATVLAWFWKQIHEPELKRLLGRGRDRADPIGAGHLLLQPELARTLRAIAAQGDAGFYAGETAARVARAMKKHGGLVTEQDLSAYRPVVREPLTFVYRGFEVHTMPPPSMGGIALASIMLTLQELGSSAAPTGSAAALHLFVEASRRAYADRRAIGADPDFQDAVLLGSLRNKLLDPRYHRERAPAVSRTRATPSRDVLPLGDTGSGTDKTRTPPRESTETTHFSVVDAHGNAVACTITLSAAFGARLVVPGTGVILSNAMGAFSPEGVNTLAPKKRMASSMTPAIVLAEGKLAVVMGSPGGDTIPGTVAQVLRNLLDFHMPIDQAVESGRLHHQWLPDEIRVEEKRAPPPLVLSELEKMGHVLKKSPIPIGDANSIVVELGQPSFWGHADTRKGGTAMGPSSLPVSAGTGASE